MRYVLERGVLGPSLRDGVHEIVDVRSHPRRAVVTNLAFRFGTKLTALLNAADVEARAAEPEVEDAKDLSDEERARYDQLIALVRDLVDFGEPRTVAEERAFASAREFLEEAS